MAFIWPDTTVLYTIAGAKIESPTPPNGTAPTMIELLQEINKTLTENLKWQNERIVEIEAKLANNSASGVQKASTPAPIIPEIAGEEVVLEAAKDDHEDEADGTIEGGATSKLEV